MSLRTRLTISYVGFFAVALIILDIALYLIVYQSLIMGIDNELRLGANLLQQGFTDSNKTPRGYFNGDSWVLLLKTPRIREFEATNLYVQVYQDDGTLIAGSPNLEQPLAVDPGLLQQALQGKESVHTIDTGQLWQRELLVPLVFGDRVVAVLQIVRSMSETERALKLLIYALAGGGIVVLLAAAQGGAWLTRAALRPIDEITLTAQSIVGATDLSRRVPVPAAQDELQRLTLTINDLLSRLEALFTAQRRLIADVSHELRTPLTAMQGNMEVLGRGAWRNPELLSESLDDMRREVARLIRLVNDLLLLAQSEAGLSMRCEPVELDTLLLEVHRELRPLAQGVELSLGDEDQVVVQGDRDRIKQALLNLGFNALQYTPPGGSVTLGLSREGDYAALTVADTGAGIAEQDLPYIFDRFYRADRARSHDRGGAGLGLAIVKWIAEVHHGSVSVTSSPGAGSRFTLLLPIASEGLVLNVEL